MEIKEISDQKIWNDFVTGCDDYTFLQAWEWGETNLVQGERLWRLGLYEEGEIAGLCQAFSVSARRGKFLFVPHGPLFKNFSSDRFNFLISHLIKIAKESDFVFLRISPWMTEAPENRALFEKLGLRLAPTFMHAENAWLVDISKDEKAILSGMRKTTRNLINRGGREGIEIIKSKEMSDFDSFYNLQLETAKRNHFVAFTRKFLGEEFSVFGKNDRCLLFLGKVGQEIVAASLIIFFGKFAFYHVSGSKETKEPVNYVMQWEAILEAKRRGCQIYNMWGVAPSNKPNHPWAGLTTFKAGFGGYPKNYLPSYDFVFSPRYGFSYLIEKFPRTLRAKLKFG